MYFRSVSCLPQKALKNLKMKDSYSFENNQLSPTKDLAYEYTYLFNQQISILLETMDNISTDIIMALFLTNIGTQIDGLWRNNRGANSEKTIASIILENLTETNSITAMIDKKNKIVPLIGTPKIDELYGSNKIYKGFVLNNQSKIIFSSEPDISLIDKNNNLLGSIEIKGGIDQAGALERYGATKKSFEHARNANPKCHNIFICSCITSEVKSRVLNDTLFDNSYDLLELTKNKALQINLMNEILKVLKVI